MGTTITPLKTALPNEGPAAYYDEEFMDVLETHMPYFRGEGSNSIGVEPKVAERFRGDFFGILKTLGVPPQYWFIVMRLNDLTNPIEYTTEMLSLLIPDFTYIDKLRQTYVTLQKIT